MAVELATAYITLIPSARGIAAGIRSELAGAEMTQAAAQSGESVSKSFFSGFKGTAGLLAATGIVAGLAEAVKSAGNFQSVTELLVTAGGESQAALGRVRDGILAIAVATGTSTGQLAEGMYTLEKAGIRGASGLDVLRVAAEGARAENVDLGTMTNALTSIMASYHLPASQATQVTNELVAASGAAKTTMQEFAGSLSTVLPVASASGLSFAQVAGAVATLTSHGTSAQEATQELANTIRGLQAPSAVASNEMAQFGINSNTVSTQLGKLGLTGTLSELTSAITSQMGPAGLVMLNAFHQSQGAAADMQTEMSKMPPSLQKLAEAFSSGQLSMAQWRKDARALPADQRLMMQGFMATYTQAHKFNDLLTSGSPAAQTYAAALEKMLGGATGLNTALMLTGGSSAAFAQNVNTIAAAGEKGGQNISTWAQTQATFNVQMGRLKEVAQTTGITLGTALLPKLTAFGGWIANNLGAVKASAAVITTLGVVMLAGAVAAKAAAAAEGVYAVLTGEASAKTGLQVIALVAQKTAMAAVSLGLKAWAAAQWLVNVAMDANPIGLIVLAVAALVGGIILAYTHCAAFRNAIQDMWHFIVRAFDDAWPLIKTWGPLVLAAILPMIGIPLLIWQHWSQIAGFVHTAFDDAWKFIKTWGPLILTAIFPVLGVPLLIWQHWSAIVGLLSGIWQTVSSTATRFFEALPGKILAALSAFPHLLEVAAQDAIAGFIVGLAYAAIGVWDFFTKIVPTALGFLVGFDVKLLQLGERALSAMASGMVTAASAVWSFVLALPGRVLNGWERIGTDALHLGEAALSGMASGMTTAASAVWSFVLALPGRVLNGWIRIGTDALHLGSLALSSMAFGMTSAASAVWSFVTSVPGRIIAALGALGGLLVGAGGSVISGLSFGITSAWHGVVGWFAGLPGTFGGMFSGCVNWLVGAGEQIMNGLLNGITSGLNGVKSFVGGIAGKIVSWKGPPAYDATILIGNGQLIMKGLVAGISSQMPVLKSTLGDVTATVANGVGLGQAGTLGGASVPLSPASVGAVPARTEINVTAYNPAEAARQTAAEIGWLQLTRGE